MVTDDPSARADASFLHAVVVGALVGIPVSFAVMTVAFSLVAGHSLAEAAGYSILPAFFCGPFLGGLFTTALADSHHEIDVDAGDDRHGGLAGPAAA